MTRHEEISFRASVPKLASVRVYRWRVSYSLVPLALSLLSKENNVASLCNLCKMYTPLVEKRKEREISRRKVEKDTLDPIFRVEKFESRIDERMQPESYQSLPLPRVSTRQKLPRRRQSVPSATRQPRVSRAFLSLSLFIN